MTTEVSTNDASIGRAWHTESADEVLAGLNVSIGGLPIEEAAARLERNGPNVLQEGKRISIWRILLGQFNSVLIWILIGAGVISGVLGELLDAIAILAIVILNAGIGFYQEYSAEQSIAALKKMTAPHARVRRGGQVLSVPAAHVVEGDILILSAGDLIAADARLLEAAGLSCVESTLTGEPEAVVKAPTTLPQIDLSLGDRANIVFMGTSVAGGTGQAVVVATAMKTELGRIAGMITSAEGDEATPLQQKLDAFGRVLVWGTLGLIALLFLLGLLRGTKPFELFMTAVSLAVAAVPEGLPAVVTIALSVGVMRMARRKALVRKLAAVETLGSTTVICTDKTGTLTVGAMTARAMYVDRTVYEVTGEGYDPHGEICIKGRTVAGGQAGPLAELATALLACNNAHLLRDGNAWTVVGTPTEGALLVAAMKARASREQIERDLVRIGEIPFDSDRKRSTMIRRMPSGRLRGFTNGAPGPLLERCTHYFTTAGICEMTEADRQGILDQTNAMARQALRVLGSAWRDLEEGASSVFTADAVENRMVFVGLTGIYDPPRPEGKEAIARCHASGIRVVMITGDHPETAAAIAGELGIASTVAVMTGRELDRLSDAALQARAGEISVYARVTAAHKLRIVRALKAAGEVVAMTGDGVNDAPAIKGATIGIAMGITGTEVTKQSADMIITDDNFATIVAAVEEGRGIYDNIRKTLQYLLAGNCGELLLMMVCVIVGLHAPLLPIHLLWINLVTDGLPALCLAIDPIDPEVMRRPPRRMSESITDRGFLYAMALTGVLTSGVAFGVYFYFLKTASLEAARGATFAFVIFDELLRSFSARSAVRPIWRVSPWTNLSLVSVVVVSLGIQFLSQHNVVLGNFLKVPWMPVSQFFALLAIGAIPLMVLEAFKVARSRR